MNDKRKVVYDSLNRMEVTYEVIEHPAVFTIEEMDNLGMEIKGEILKNLFIRDDKKKNFFIIVLCKQKRANLKEIRAKLDSGALTFASEEYLYKYLKLQKGEVTPFGVLNDEQCEVKVVFDSDIFSFDKVGVHPNDNTATVWLSPYDLRSVIEVYGNEVRSIEL